MKYSACLICDLMKKIKEKQKEEYSGYLEKVYKDLETILFIMESEE